MRRHHPQNGPLLRKVTPLSKAHLKSRLADSELGSSEDDFSRLPGLVQPALLAHPVVVVDLAHVA